MSTGPYFDYVDYAYDPNPPAPLADDEAAHLGLLRRQLRRREVRNRMLERRYDATQSTRHMDISVPPQLPRVEVVAGWGGKVVDAIEERIDFQGWVPVNNSDDMGLSEVYSDNFMAIESSRAHIDMCLFGVSFVTVGAGDPENDEPEILITAESPLRSTLLWDYRSRRALAGYTQTVDERNHIVMETLYLPDETITLARDITTGKTEVADRDNHGLHRVPMVRLVNKDRASNPHGRSEITPAIRYYTDAAVRTMLGMETNREFYTVPMTFALSVRPEQFGATDKMTELEKQRLGWKIISGHINLVPPNEQGESPPDIKQLTPSPPTPYIEQVKFYATMICSETGIPLSYMGLPDVVAPDGDSIIQNEYPLVRRAERRIVNANHSWREVGILSVLWRDGSIDMDAYRQIRTKFGDPSTPTRGARADEATKLTASGILISDSSVTYDRVGLDEEEQKQLEVDKRKAAARALAQSVAIQAAGQQQQPAAPGANGAPTPPPVTRNGNQGTIATQKNPNNVARGKQIAQQSGQA